MKIRHLLRGAALCFAAVLGSATAQAAITCSVITAPFMAVYDATLATPTDTESSVTISCMRLATDPATFSYELAADNGLNPQGQRNQAALAGSRLPYEIYRDAARSAAWGTQNQRVFTGNVNFGSGTVANVTLPYYVRIDAGTNVPAGTYTDTVLVALTYNGNQNAAGSLTGQIMVNPTCQFSAPPGPMVFAYTSFQTGAATASTPFAVLCTSGAPYTLSLDSTGGTLLGLSYSLALSGSAATGTGLAQNFSINGTMAGGQVGTCATAACTATNVHTLIITY